MSHIISQIGLGIFVIGLFVMTIAQNMFIDQIRSIQSSWSPIAGTILIGWGPLLVTMLGLGIFMSNQGEPWKQ